MKPISEMTDRELLEYLAGPYRPQTRLEKLEIDLEMMQLAIRALARDVEELKKAQ